MNLEVFLFLQVFLIGVVSMYSKKEKMTKTAKKIYTCRRASFIKKLEELQVADPNYIVKMAADHRILEYCNGLSVKLENISKYLKVCKVTSIGNQHRRIIRGSQTLNLTLCTDKKFQRKFVKYAPCYVKIFGSGDDCLLPNVAPCEKNQVKICTGYATWVDCHTIKAAMECGVRAANIYKLFLTNVISASMLIDCGPNFSSSTEKNSEICIYQDYCNDYFFYFLLFAYLFGIIALSCICFRICKFICSD